MAADCLNCEVRASATEDATNDLFAVASSPKDGAFAPARSALYCGSSDALKSCTVRAAGGRITAANLHKAQADDKRRALTSIAPGFGLW